MFCVECGRETDNLMHGVCLDCYLRDRRFCTPPDVVKIYVCRDCGAVCTAQHWAHLSPEEALVEHLQQQMECPGLERPRISVDADRQTVTCTGTFHGRPVEETYPFELRVKPSRCEDCGKIKSGYFEAVVQVRKEGGALTEEEIEASDHIALSEAVVEGRNYLARREALHGGLDYYLGDKSRAAAIARRLAERFDGLVDTSYTLMGMRDGQEVYRNTVLVRIPAYAKHDFVELEGRLYRVVETGKRVALRALDTGERRHLYRNEMAATTVLPLRPEEAVVVSRREREVQVLDPDTYRTVTLALPPGIEPGDTVSVIKWEGRLYAVGG
ncbi:MAG TPA: hypothetical protein ENN54_05755 [Thermoplasmatales archaeon]|nr:hypothetical protein [Thermoplasmatales archaeon]